MREPSSPTARRTDLRGSARHCASPPPRAAAAASLTEPHHRASTRADLSAPHHSAVRRSPKENPGWKHAGRPHQRFLALPFPFPLPRAGGQTTRRDYFFRASGRIPLPFSRRFSALKLGPRAVHAGTCSIPLQRDRSAPAAAPRPIASPWPMGCCGGRERPAPPCARGARPCRGRRRPELVVRAGAALAARPGTRRSAARRPAALSEPPRSRRTRERAAGPGVPVR